MAAINTIQCVMGVNLDTLRPEPSVEGYSTPGGYSYRAVKPIALAKVMSIARMIRSEYPDRGVSLSGIGGVETGADAAEFILLGSDTVQVSRRLSGRGAPVRAPSVGLRVERCTRCGWRALGHLAGAGSGLPFVP